LLVLTDRHRCAVAGRDLVSTVAAAVRGGAPTVVYREKDLPDDERRGLGEEVAAACGPAELIVASDPDLARRLGATAVHLASADPWPVDTGHAVDTGGELTLGRSCHDAAELDEAAAHGAAYVTLSPVFATASKPGYGPPLGLDGLARLVAGRDLPVVALGGVEPTNAAACLDAGASGVAVLGGVMAAPDPEAAVRALLDEGAHR
jgi:thiamine-phosphate pyrophosphorylase